MSVVIISKPEFRFPKGESTDRQGRKERKEVEQLKQGKTEITFGFSDALLNIGKDQLKSAFEKMNQSEN